MPRASWPTLRFVAQQAADRSTSSCVCGGGRVAVWTHAADRLSTSHPSCDQELVPTTRGEGEPVEYPVKTDRRTFLRRGAMGAGAAWMLSLQELAARAGHRGPRRHERRQSLRAGQAQEGRDHRSRAAEAARRLPLLVLQLDRRRDVGRRRCPNLHDGMAVVDDWRSSDDEPAARRRRQQELKARSGRSATGTTTTLTAARRAGSSWCAITKETPARRT